MPFTPEDAARLKDVANKALRELKPAGFAIGVVEGADLVFAEGFGFADIESARPQPGWWEGVTARVARGR